MSKERSGNALEDPAGHVGPDLRIGDVDHAEFMPGKYLPIGIAAGGQALAELSIDVVQRDRTVGDVRYRERGCQLVVPQEHVQLPRLGRKLPAEVAADHAGTAAKKAVLPGLEHAPVYAVSKEKPSLILRNNRLHIYYLS